MTVLPTPGSRLRWALTDSLTLTRRYLAHIRLQPVQLAVQVGFPILIMLMFVFLLGGMMGSVPGGDYRQAFVPGMFVMTMLFGLSTTMIAVVTDTQRGITDRFRSMPMSPSAVMVGRAVADLVVSVIGLVVLVLAGLAIGWRPDAGPAAVLAAVGLLLLLRFALLWVGIYLGLRAGNPGTLAAVQTFEFPVAFLSGIFAAPHTMPVVLSTIAEWNPLSSTAAAVRELFGSPGWGATSWIADNAVLMAVLWPVLIIAVFAPLAVRHYQEMSK
ncbi:ABC transporter permease [Actinomycetes bacterium KLBMP 9759]